MFRFHVQSSKTIRDVLLITKKLGILCNHVYTVYNVINPLKLHTAQMSAISIDECESVLPHQFIDELLTLFSKVRTDSCLASKVFFWLVHFHFKILSIPAIHDLKCVRDDVLASGTLKLSNDAS